MSRPLGNLDLDKNKVMSKRNRIWSKVFSAFPRYGLGESSYESYMEPSSP